MVQLGNLKGAEILNCKFEFSFHPDLIYKLNTDFNSVDNKRFFMLSFKIISKHMTRISPSPWSLSSATRGWLGTAGEAFEPAFSKKDLVEGTKTSL
jgi:hypothetical protein